MNKRGISAIIATVLIVLITVAAVTIIWTAVIPMIKNQASFENELVNLDIETAEGYTYWDESKNVSCVQVSRGGGGRLIGVEVIFLKEGNSGKGYFDEIEIPDVNQKKKKCFVVNFGEPESIKIAPIFEGGRVGEVTSEYNLLLSGTYEGDVEDLDVIGGSKEGEEEPGEEPPVVNTYYLDSDGDGYGDISQSVEAESSPEGYVSDSTDCDDTDRDVNPAVGEVCFDNVDNNCDGNKDELSVCGLIGSAVSYWNFDDVGSFAEDIVGENDAIPQNGVNCNVEGIKGKACLFDGVNDYMNTSNSESFKFGINQNVSFVAWVKPSSIQNAYVGIVSSKNSAGWWSLYLNDFNSTHMRIGGTYSNGIVPVMVGEWQFLVGTFDAGTRNYTTYFNGEVDVSEIKLTTSTSAGTYNYIVIGANYAGSSERINATLDEIMIFNKTLSISEIQEIRDYFSD